MHPTSDWLRTWTRFAPEAEAVVDLGTGRRWTYAALLDESLRQAARLVRHGVRPTDRVGVLAHNRGETLALLFACAELGAILFPMNWRLSPAELSWQLDHCDPRVLLTDAAHARILRGRPALSLEEDPGPDRATGPGSRPGDPWMIMYTSGSTGRPKGALLTHRQVEANGLNTILACDLARSSSTLTFAPLFHTGGMNSLSTPLLLRGGRVVLTPRLEAGEALAAIQVEGITHLMGVPTIFQLLADHPDFEGADLSRVRDAICGGAALSASLLRRYLDRGIPLRQGFGLTEVGPNCFSMPHARIKDKMVDATQADGGALPATCVGRPIHLIEARILRPDGSEAGVGEPGELVLSGEVVFGGYHGDPEATAQSLRGGAFHTGDILSRDAEGFFYVRGRLKEMYISGGENVYPAEVEAVLQGCPGVGQVAVVGVPDPHWGEVGRAFVEPAGHAALDPATIGDWLEGRLARYKRPKQIVLMATLPRTGSGKIDKPALRALEA